MSFRFTIKNIFRLIALLSISLCFGYLSFAQEQLSELLNVKTENNLLIFEVARKYPQLKISNIKEQSTKKILIELSDSKYHQNFHFDIPTKQLLLSGLDFIDDVSIAEGKISEVPYKVAILLTLKDSVNLTPKIDSIKDNLIQISFTTIQETSTLEPVMMLEKGIHEIYNEAVDNQLSGNLNKAEELYDEVFVKDKNFYLARFNLAKIYLDKQDYEKAVNALTLLIEDFDSVSKELIDKDLLLLTYNTLGNVYYFSGKYDDAFNQFHKVLSIDSNSYLAYYGSGLLYEKMNKFKPAIENFKKAIELKSDFPEAYYHLSAIYLVKKKKHDASLGFKKIIEIAPGTKISEISRSELGKIENDGKHKK